MENESPLQRSITNENIYMAEGYLKNGNKNMK